MSTDRPTRAETARATTDRLLRVAHAAFAGRGFSAVSLDTIAAEAGVTRGALHHHFTNKAGLLEAVLRRIDAEIGAELQPVFAAEADDWAGFRASFHAYLDAVLQPSRLRILFQDAPAVLGMRSVDILLQSGLAEVIALLQSLAASGRIRAPDPEALAVVLNSTSVALAFWVAESPEEPARLTRAHATLAELFDGMTAGPQA